MKVLLYNLKNAIIGIIDSLNKLDDISIHFAVSENDVFSISKEIKPDIILIGNNKKIIPKLLAHNPDIQLFQVGDESGKYNNDIELMHPVSGKHISLNKLIGVKR